VEPNCNLEAITVTKSDDNSFDLWVGDIGYPSDEQKNNHYDSKGTIMFDYGNLYVKRFTTTYPDKCRMGYRIVTSSLTDPLVVAVIENEDVDANNKRWISIGVANPGKDTEYHYLEMRSTFPTNAMKDSSFDLECYIIADDADLTARVVIELNFI